MNFSPRSLAFAIFSTRHEAPCDYTPLPMSPSQAATFNRNLHISQHRVTMAGTGRMRQSSMNFADRWLPYKQMRLPSSSFQTSATFSYPARRSLLHFISLDVCLGDGTSPYNAFISSPDSRGTSVSGPEVSIVLDYTDCESMYNSHLINVEAHDEMVLQDDRCEQVFVTEFA